MDIVATSGPYFHISPEHVARTRQEFDLTQAAVQRDLDIILAWCDQQQHFPSLRRYRHFIECIYMAKKGSLERTKENLEMYFTIKTLFPLYNSRRNPADPDIQAIFKIMNYTPMPKLNPHDGTRLVCHQVLDEDYTKMDMDFVLEMMCTIIEFRMHRDYFPGDHYLLDLKNVRMGHVMRVSPQIIRKGLLIVQGGLGLRIKGIHIYNAPPFVNTILTIVRAALSKKLAGRIRVHANEAELQQHVPKEILPRDYGGDQKSVSELAEIFTNELCNKENMELFAEIEELKSDEGKRVGGKMSSDLFGIEGSFRQLDID